MNLDIQDWLTAISASIAFLCAAALAVVAAAAIVRGPGHIYLDATECRYVGDGKYDEFNGRTYRMFVCEKDSITITGWASIP